MRVVEASLAPPLWMGPLEDSETSKTQVKDVLEDYIKILEDETLTDVVLVVEGERFPAHRVILAARSEYFRGMFLSGIQGGCDRCWRCFQPMCRSRLCNSLTRNSTCKHDAGMDRDGDTTRHRD